MSLFLLNRYGIKRISKFPVLNFQNPKRHNASTLMSHETRKSGVIGSLISLASILTFDEINKYLDNRPAKLEQAKHDANQRNLETKVKNMVIEERKQRRQFLTKIKENSEKETIRQKELKEKYQFRAC